MRPPKKRLLDQVRDRLWLKNYAYQTDKSNLYWIKQQPRVLILAWTLSSCDRSCFNRAA
jgi:hypothetical protein